MKDIGFIGGIEINLLQDTNEERKEANDGIENEKEEVNEEFINQNPGPIKGAKVGWFHVGLQGEDIHPLQLGKSFLHRFTS